MATAPLPKITKSLNSHLTCPIHQDIFKRPKTLSCQHVFCEECIEKWTAANGGVLRCPECRSEQPLPEDGTRGLPDNFRIAGLCEFAESLEEKGLPDDAACDNICLHCNIPVCNECVLHNDHKTVAVEEFPKLIGQAKSRLKDIFEAAEVLEKTKAQLSENYTLIKRESDEHVRKLKRQLTQAHVNLVSDIEKTYSEKDATLAAQLESLSRARDEIREVLQQQEVSEGHLSSPDSLMTVHGQQLWNKLIQIPQQNLQLDPKESSVLSVQWDNDLVTSVQTESLGSIVTKALPSGRHSTLSLSTIRADVQSDVKIQVVLQDKVGSPVYSANISSLNATVTTPEGVIGQLPFRQGKESNVEAVFKPRDIGKYKIEAKLSGSPVKHSPQNLFIKPRGEMLSNNQGNLKNPHDIIEHDDNFYIADKGNNQVVVLDKEFKFVGKFRNPLESPFNKIDPYALAYTGRTFVVTDLKNHCVLEFCDFDFMQRFGQSVLSRPTGIACDNTGKVYVADAKKNCIFVFDHRREKIAVLGSSGAMKGQFNTPWFIDVDSKGDVVVADFGNHRIQVINPNTSEVNKLIDVNVEQKIWDVRGLAVDRNDNIFVTVRQSTMRIWSTEHVFAYTPEGVFLGSFGEGFHYVRGMTITQNEDHAKAIVVDGANHRIKGYLL